MIKIKDYIFNENDIRKIYYNKDKSCLCVGFRDEDLVTNWVENATFEDIEWNYDKNNNIHEEYVISQLKDYENKIKELEKEKNANESLYNKWESLVKRISKALQYLKDNYEYQEDICEECSKILRGVKND